MRPLSRILFGVFLATCWSGVATADPQEPTQSLDPSAFRADTNLQPDLAFARFVSLEATGALQSLAGPSSMECTSAATHDGIENCIVTTIRLAASMPAALAQR
jgi:hypothetical protein